MVKHLIAFFSQSLGWWKQNPYEPQKVKSKPECDFSELSSFAYPSSLLKLPKIVGNANDEGSEK